MILVAKESNHIFGKNSISVLVNIVPKLKGHEYFIKRKVIKSMKGMLFILLTSCSPGSFYPDVSASTLFSRSHIWNMDYSETEKFS